MRRLKSLGFSVLTIVACSPVEQTGEDGCVSNSDCPSGRVGIGRDCAPVGHGDSQCNGEASCSQSICLNGPRSDLVLDASGRKTPDAAAPSARHANSQGEVVLLPHGLVSRVTDALTISNQAGSCSSELSALKGEQGERGPAGPPPEMTLDAGLQGDGSSGSPLSIDFDAVSRRRLGGTPERAAKSCQAIVDAGHSVGSQYYWLDPNDSGTPFQAYCEMGPQGEGWTLCFAYDHTVYDSYNWPSIEASRNKLLVKTWGMTRLHGNGTRQGNFCNRMAVQEGDTRLRAEVVTVTDSTVLASGTFTLGKSNFFSQEHPVGDYDCLVSNDGGQRLMYANYAQGPARITNKQALQQCKGAPGEHLTNSITHTDDFGVDGFLVFSAAAEGVENYEQDMSYHVNWYANVDTEALETGTSQKSVTKFGKELTYHIDKFGRQGASPGITLCYTDRAMTNAANNQLKQRIWLR